MGHDTVDDAGLGSRWRLIAAALWADDRGLTLAEALREVEEVMWRKSDAELAEFFAGFGRASEVATAEG